MFKFTHQDLRRDPTTCERILWEYLRARKMVGLKFRRQHPLGPFIVDFICLSKKIIIEVDGGIHDERRDYDRQRDEWLQLQGFTVLRIKNEELEKNLEETLLRLRRYLLRRMGFKGM
jgi:very-short-patch-repair endonuclease